jgi:hypothetical protein
MSSYTWSSTFSALFSRCVSAYSAGQRDFNAWFSPADDAFLKLVAAVRRDYLRVVQKGVTSTRTVKPSELPAKSAAVEGISWLPRLIAKARAKLRGEMDPDTMYGCGGDRGFFDEWDLDPADFLRLTWAAGEDDQKIVSYVKDRAARAEVGL